jgi:hypothetical protein
LHTGMGHVGLLSYWACTQMCLGYLCHGWRMKNFFNCCLDWMHVLPRISFGHIGVSRAFWFLDSFMHARTRWHFISFLACL